MRKVLLGVVGLAVAVPASAEVVKVRFQGSIPGTNSFFGSGSDFNLLNHQKAFIAAMYPAQAGQAGASYDFTFQYDTGAPLGSDGRYAVSLISGNAGGITEFAGWSPSLYFQQAGSYTYLILAVEKKEQFGFNHFLTGAYFAIGDNDGNVQQGVLPSKLNKLDLDFITASFEARGRDQAYRSMVDSVSRGLSQLPVGSGSTPVPEPATWAMMIAGFALVGSAVRRGARIPPTYA